MADNHTPFDNDLLHDPHAPRNTQPLSVPSPTTQAPIAPTPIAQTPIAQTPAVSQALPLPPTVQSPGVQSPGAPAFIPTPVVPTSNLAVNSRPLPPQVVSGKLSDDDDAAATTPQSGAKTGRLPTPTLIGLAMAGGALGVTLLSAFFYRSVPRPAVKGLATSTTIAEPRPATAPRVVPMPDGSPGEDQAEADSSARTSSSTPNRATSKTRGASNSSRVATRDDASDDSSASISVEDDASNSGSIGIDSTRSENADEDARATSRNQSGGATGRSNRSANISPDHARRDSGAASGTRTGQNDAAKSDSNRAESGTSGRADTASAARGNGYSITPPSGFRLIRKGRRTIWRGPGGAQILVETAPAGNRSPRRDWERLDAALSKKYGARYRSRGISDTNLAGRAGAAWEFELDGKNGTTRKLDVSVHHKGRGYAVLGSAPAQNFDAVRPQIEAAINSFQIEDAASNAPSPRPNRPDSPSNDTARGDSAQDEYYAPNVDSTQSERGY